MYLFTSRFCKTVKQDRVEKTNNRKVVEEEGGGHRLFQGLHHQGCHSEIAGNVPGEPEE